MRGRFSRYAAIVVVALVAVAVLSAIYPPAPTPHQVRPGLCPAGCRTPSTSCRPRLSRPSRTPPASAG